MQTDKGIFTKHSLSYVFAIAISIGLFTSVPFAKSFGQTTAASFDKLSFRIDGEWSRRIEKDKIIYDNYNLKSQSRAAITLYNYVAADDEKTFFQESWSKLWPDSVAAPRPRRLYTEDGQLIFTAGAPVTNSVGEGYGQLFVFSDKKGYQPIVVWLPDLVSYRKSQNEWSLMAQTAVMK